MEGTNLGERGNNGGVHGIWTETYESYGPRSLKSTGPFSDSTGRYDPLRQ